jgi:hypothetical protein
MAKKEGNKLLGMVVCNLIHFSLSDQCFVKAAGRNFLDLIASDDHFTEKTQPEIVGYV